MNILDYFKPMFNILKSFIIINPFVTIPLLIYTIIEMYYSIRGDELLIVGLFRKVLGLKKPEKILNDALGEQHE